MQAMLLYCSDVQTERRLFLPHHLYSYCLNILLQLSQLLNYKLSLLGFICVIDACYRVLELFTLTLNRIF